MRFPWRRREKTDPRDSIRSADRRQQQAGEREAQDETPLVTWQGCLGKSGGSNELCATPEKRDDARESMPASHATGTNCDRPPKVVDMDKVAPRKELVIYALIAGQTASEAARTAGVSRRTIQRWLKDDFDFQAALNSCRRELRDALESRLTMLTELATACLEQAVAHGNANIALQLLKGLGRLTASPIGSEEPDQLRAEAQVRQTIHDLQRKLDAARIRAGHRTLDVEDGTDDLERPPREHYERQLL